MHKARYNECMTMTVDEAVARTVELLKARRRYGEISALAQACGVTRMTLYNRAKLLLEDEKPATSDKASGLGHSEATVLDDKQAQDTASANGCATHHAEEV